MNFSLRKNIKTRRRDRNKDNIKTNSQFLREKKSFQPMTLINKLIKVEIGINKYCKRIRKDLNIFHINPNISQIFIKERKHSKGFIFQISFRKKKRFL